MRTKRLFSFHYLVSFCLSTYVALAFTSCVSVNIGPKPGSKAEGVQWLMPEGFVEVKTDDADHAWRNSKNSNTISYNSVCNEPSDPSLETMQKTTLGSLTESEVKSEKRIQFNGREALDTRADGSLDGVKVALRFVAFKRNSCNYTISYIALAKSFESDASKFDDFLRSFRTP